MPARICSISALSPKPLSMRLAPSAASARAVASPIPEVEPVTSAVLPLSMAVLVELTAAEGPAIGCGTGAGTCPYFCCSAIYRVLVSRLQGYGVRLEYQSGAVLGQKNPRAGGVSLARP